MGLATTFFGVLFLAAIANAGVSVNNPFYCYSTDWIRPQNQFHNVRTSYEAVRRTQTNPAVSSCTPSRFWYFGRHGGRNPEVPLLHRMFEFADSSIQADIQRNSEQGRTTLCRQDLELIRGWTRNMNISLEHERRTTVAGWTAMQNIGRRYSQFYPTLFPEVYDRNWYLFFNADSPQTHASMRGFVDGVFGEGRWSGVYFEPIPENDWFLRPINFCPAFVQETAVRREQEAFRQGPEVAQMLSEINHRLGFQGAEQLNFDRVLTMWEWCRFELASTFEISDSPLGETSAWCAPFTVNHHQVMEYFTDLHYYYFTGYGVRNQRLIENLNCGAMQDLLMHIQGLPAGGPVSKVYVTHSQMVQALLVTLGAMRDNTHLHQYNFAQQSARHWKTSFLTPNAGNIAVVTYACPGGDNDVYFLLNERPLLIPGCSSNGVCKSSFLLNRFQRFIGVNCEQFFCTSN